MTFDLGPPEQLTDGDSREFKWLHSIAREFGKWDFSPIDGLAPSGIVLDIV